jgi:hypothetical protein
MPGNCLKLISSQIDQTRTRTHKKADIRPNFDTRYFAKSWQNPESRLSRVSQRHEVSAQLKAF